MGGVALADVVSEVDLAGGPEESELALGFSAAEPVEVHVHGFFFARDDGFLAPSPHSHPMRQLHSSRRGQQNHHPSQNKIYGHELPLAPL